ncbi:MAG TPA: hypothetical protein VIL86_09355 [Tepidisphaeraceae bacterium]|jgi:hypothetical protein
MKKLFIVILLGMSLAPMIGCHAEADVKDNDRDRTTYKKETTVKTDRDGDTRVKTERTYDR